MCLDAHPFLRNLCMFGLIKWSIHVLFTRPWCNAKKSRVWNTAIYQVALPFKQVINNIEKQFCEAENNFVLDIPVAKTHPKNKLPNRIFQRFPFDLQWPCQSSQLLCHRKKMLIEIYEYYFSQQVQKRNNSDLLLKYLFVLGNVLRTYQKWGYKL